MKTLALLFLITSTSTFAAMKEWVFDKSHSVIKFDIDHLVVSEVSGKFDDIKAEIQADNPDFTDAKFKVTIQVNSINTNDSKRDEHLKSEEFFDVKKYPEIQFTGKKFEKLKNGNYKIYGTIEMHGIKKEVVFDGTFGGIVKDPWGGTRSGVKFSIVIDRFDYGLKYNSLLEAGGMAIGNKVRISGNFELIEKKYP